MGRSHRRRRAGLPVLVAAALLTSACAAERSPDRRTVTADEGAWTIEIPVAWGVFDDADIQDAARRGGASAEELAQAAERTTTYGFDGSGAPSIDNIFEPTATAPWGFARRIRTPPTTPFGRDELRTMIMGIDPLSSEAPGTVDLVVLEQQAIDHGDGLFGERIVFEVDFGDERITTDQTVVRDLVDGSIYQLVFACDAACYLANRGQIDGIVRSWALLETP